MEKYKKIKIECPNCKRELRLPILVDEIDIKKAREIKITKCGEWEDSGYNDRISIELSPIELSELKEIFQSRAVNTKNYDEQTKEREEYELFRVAYKIWQKEREEKDK